jgi:hypothetical protein
MKTANFQMLKFLGDFEDAQADNHGKGKSIFDDGDQVTTHSQMKYHDEFGVDEERFQALRIQMENQDWESAAVLKWREDAGLNM